MEATLEALGSLLLKAIPTLILVVLLHFYLKRVFFQPLSRVLQQRSELTEGARRIAEESLARAAEKAAEYERALRAARAEIYREQELSRQRLRQEHAEAVQRERAGTQAAIEEARRQLSADLEASKESLEAQSEVLAARIAEIILQGRLQ